MVLKKLFVLVLALLSTFARAQVLVQSVQNPDCQIFSVDRKQSLIVKTTRRFPVGTQLETRRAAGTRIFKTFFPKTSQAVVFGDPQEKSAFLIGNGVCLFSANRHVETKSLAPSAPVVTQKNLTFSLQTFKTRVTVHFPNGETAALNVQLIGALPEFSYSWRTSHSEWGFGVGAFMGTAEIGRSLAEQKSGDLVGFDYQANNLKIFGGEVSLFYLLRPVYKNVALGVKMPLRWQKTSWPLPGEDYSVTPQNDLSLSYLLEARVERDSITWIQSFGFYKKWGNILWSLGASYRF